MPKLTRETVKQFGASGTSTDFGQFGSKTAGTPLTSQNPSVIMALGAWATGWATAAVGAAFNPFLEDMNSFCLATFYFLANMFERGIPDYDSGTTYYKGAYVGDPAGSGQIWYSLQDNNLGNTPPLSASNALWQWANAPQVPVGTLVDFAGIVIPVSFLAGDGAAVSRTTYAILFGILNITRNGTLTSGSPIITGLSQTSDLQTGWFISGAGIPSGARVLTIDSPTQITLTLNALSSATNSLVLGPWGIGDGSTTFNTPDTRRRVTVGSGGVGTAALANTLGATGGEEAHVLTIAEMPPHHHTYTFLVYNFGVGGGGSGNPGSASPGQITGDTGGGAAFNVLQPSMVVQKLIKAF